MCGAAGSSASELMHGLYVLHGAAGTRLLMHTQGLFIPCGAVGARPSDLGHQGCVSHVWLRVPR